MKHKPIIIIKNILCSVTIIWSAIMLAEYVMVLLPVDINGFLFELFDFFVIFLYAGIVGVPVLFVLSAIFMAIAKRFYDADNGTKLNTVAVVLPIITFALMLVTNFNARLQ